MYIVKNMQWCHLYVSCGLIKPIKSAFINKSNTVNVKKSDALFPRDDLQKIIMNN